MSTSNDTFTAPDLGKKVDREAWDVARAMSRAIRNGHNRLDARPSYSEFKQRALDGGVRSDASER